MTERDDPPQTKDVTLVSPRAREAEGHGQNAALPLSLQTIFEAEATYVGLSLRRLGVRERDLEDLTHDVFVVVHRQLRKYDPTRPLRPWLFGIAARVALAYRRRAGHTLEVVRAGIHAVDGAALADEQLDAHRMRQVVLQALEVLSAEQREVFIMHDIDGYAMPTVADGLGIRLNTGYSRLRLARAAFGAEVDRILGRGRPR